MVEKYSDMDFESLLAKYDYKFKRGDIVKGAVCAYESDGAIIDIGSKSTAFVPSYEISSDRKAKAEDVLEKTLVYLNVRIYGLLFAFPIVIFRSFFIGITQTKVLTYNAIIILGINIVLDYLLIFGKHINRYYLRHFPLLLLGVLALVAGKFAEHGVSIASMVQKGERDERGYVQLILLTHKASEQAVRLALSQLDVQKVAAGSVIRVEGC